MATAPASARTALVLGGSSSIGAAVVRAVAERVDVRQDSVGDWTFTRLAELTVEEMDASRSLNLRSVLLALRESARRLPDGGRVVVLSSAVADLAPARQISDAAARGELETAVRVAANELGRQGITVTRFGPVPRTPQLCAGPPRTTPDKAVEAMSSASALRWVTGSVLDATSGLR